MGTQACNVEEKGNDVCDTYIAYIDVIAWLSHRIKIKAEGQLLSDPLIFLRHVFKRG